jgi:monomeric isocitrate dehydrogenase
MLSIVPLMNGGGLFETGAGGSALNMWNNLLKKDTFVGILLRVFSPRRFVRALRTIFKQLKSNRFV